MLARGKARGWALMLALMLWMVPARAGYLLGNATNNSGSPYPNGVPQASLSAEYIDPASNYLGNWLVGGSWASNPSTFPCPSAFYAPIDRNAVCVGPESYAYIDSLSGAGQCLPGNNPDGVPYPCGLGITFTGVLPLPDLGAAPPTQFTETIPVTFTASWGFLPNTGWATATVTLNESSDSYVFSSATYVLDPAPEPEAISLMGLGLGAIFVLRLASRRRRSTT